MLREKRQSEFLCSRKKLEIPAVERGIPARSESRRRERDRERERENKAQRNATEWLHSFWDVVPNDGGLLVEMVVPALDIDGGSTCVSCFAV
ncbi:hypothetical protein TIFTF001_029575 [Ficus carica]|uniref:Uncharacterized protein n=1 Tax=Ficus carica TaxID=3494 RepID=A0AA88DSL9_FICCA|nr:hypothetical protein TIFTF001_029575 [Ficus carica]